MKNLQKIRFHERRESDKLRKDLSNEKNIIKERKEERKLQK